MTICAFTIVEAQSVVCGQAAIKRWTNENSPGSQAGTIAPIEIDGSTDDWAQHITGPFAYYFQPVPTYQPDPHVQPIADAIGNIQVDALKGDPSELDRPGQEHRDLRYFAFTYDVTNVYFYFRRPGNNSAQVTLYYFIDINVDGFMRTGEPVIKIVYNGGQGTLSMAYFVEDPSSVNGPGGVAGSWQAGKGNSMSATASRPGSNNTSQWILGAADGWAMPGSIVDVPTGSLPLPLQAGELAEGRGLTDNYSDGATATGYGAEFAIPWRFFKLYGGPYSYDAQYPPLGPQNVFTWHVSLSGGNSGIEGAEDNAGGCCSGLAVSGQPDVEGTPTFTTSSLYDFKYRISYQETRNLNSSVTTSQLAFKNPKDANEVPIPASSVAAWTVLAYKDLDCDNTADGASITFAFNPTLSYPTVAESGGDRVYVFTPSNPTDTKFNIAANATACFFLDINTINGGWPPLKTSLVSFSSSTEFNLGTLACNAEQIGGTTKELEVLPVKFVSFNAARSGQNVNLTWQTASEENNTGFEVQRYTGSGAWQTVGFVATKAVNGNSGTPLSYQYTDINTTKGITQYRLRQIDKDYRSAYSVIRSVRGLGQKSNTIIYPNPSSDGKVNVVFDDANSIRDLSLMDVNGKTLKQWKGVTNNNIRIDNLNAGFYTIRIVNVETGEQVVEKFIVNKR